MSHTLNRQSSTSQSVIPLIACLIAAEDLLGKNRIWYPTNDEQARFLEDFFNAGRTIDWSKLSKDELARICTRVAEELRAFFEERGFEFQIDDFGPGEFGVGAVQKMPVKWIEEGSELEVPIDGEDYAAAQLEAGVSVINIPSHPYPVARVASDGDIMTYMTRLDECPKGLDLLRYGSMLSSSNFRTSHEYEGVVFPKIDLDVDVNVDWMKHLSTVSADGAPFRVSKAAQKNRLKMNHKGALGESAAYMIMESYGISMTQPLFIDGPFIVWFEKRGFSFPYFAAYCAQDSWKDPGDFEI